VYCVGQGYKFETGWATKPLWKHYAILLMGFKKTNQKNNHILLKLFVCSVNMKKRTKWLQVLLFYVTAVIF